LSRDQLKSPRTARPVVPRANRLTSTLSLSTGPEAISNDRQSYRFRLPSLTGLLVRGLVLLFGFTVFWKLALLGIDTYELSRFKRPPVAAQAISPTIPQATDAGLSNILREAGLPGGVVGGYVRNLTTGAGAGLSADRRFPAASLSKLPVMVEVFKQQRLRRFSWDDQLSVSRDQWTDGSRVLQARVGESLRIKELLRLMIVESDNIAANMLLDLVGVTNVNQTIDAMGLHNTRVIDRLKETNLPSTTPEDMGRLLEIIATGRLVDAQTSEEAVRLLERNQAQTWLADGLPWWGKLAHKWGDLPNARHDAGTIYTPRNQTAPLVLTDKATRAAAPVQIPTPSRKVSPYSGGPAQNPDKDRRTRA